MFLKKLSQIGYSAKPVKVRWGRLLHFYLVIHFVSNIPSFEFYFHIPSSELITFLLSDPSHHGIRKEHPVFLRENQCCAGGMDFITMVD